MILDDGGDATLLMHLGQRCEKDLSLIDTHSSEEERILLRRHPQEAGGRPDLVQRARPRRSSA